MKCWFREEEASRFEMSQKGEKVGKDASFQRDGKKTGLRAGAREEIQY